MRPAYAILLLVPACSFELGFDGTRYRCGDGDRCPAGQSCVAGVCTSSAIDAPEVDAAGPAAPCGNLSLLRDTFDQGGAPPFWYAFNDTGASTSETGGALNIDLPAGADVYAGYISAYVYDLHGGAILAQVEQVSGANTILEVRNHLGSVAQLVHENGDVLAATFNVPGAAEHARRAWNPAERYWRLRADDGDLVWELSTDRQAWSELHRRPLPFPVEHVYGAVSAGGAAPAASRARFADVNLDGSPAGFCSASMLREDFAAAPFEPTWVEYADSGCTIAEQGGDLVMTFQGNAGNAFCGLNALHLWDLTDGGSIVVDGSVFPSQASFVSYVQASAPGSGGNTRVELLVDGTVFEARSWVVGANQGGRTVTVDDVNHRFWRLRGEGSTAIFDTSPDGTAWTEFHRTEVPWDLAIAEISLGAGNYGTTPPVTIRLPGINSP